MNFSRRGFLIVLFLATGITRIGAAPTTFRPRFTVQLNVQVSETSKEALISDMTNALKKLNDVDVPTDGSGLWILYMNVAPIMDKSGLKGYAISTVIADQNSSKILKELPSDIFKTPEAEHTVKELAKEQVDIREHLMLTCTADGLSKAYSQIVDYFDETCLVPVREEAEHYNFDKSGSLLRGY